MPRQSPRNKRSLMAIFIQRQGRAVQHQQVHYSSVDVGQHSVKFVLLETINLMDLSSGKGANTILTRKINSAVGSRVCAAGNDLTCLQCCPFSRESEQALASPLMSFVHQITLRFFLSEAAPDVMLCMLSPLRPSHGSTANG